MSAYRRLQFSAYCHTQFGEYVCICGNIPQLGYWNPFKALRLKTQESYYPVWKSFDSIYVLENHPVEFKIVIVNSKNQFKWENIVQNRIIVPDIDSYIKLTVNEFETYEIFPFCDGDDNVRTGMNILNDLSSDGSSSISFKSNYKFYEYFDRSKTKKSLKNHNTSTFRNIKDLQDANQKIKTQYQFVTFLDSLLELQENPKAGKEFITSTQDCTKKTLEEARSHSTNSDKLDFDQDSWANDNWVVYCAGTENIMKNHRNARPQHNNNKMTSLNKIFYSNSSQSLSFGREG